MKKEKYIQPEIVLYDIDTQSDILDTSIPLEQEQSNSSYQGSKYNDFYQNEDE